MDGGTYKNRYDVTILVNGLPLVQIELKRRGLEMKEAFNQIQRYQKHSYWSAQGLFHFVQLFVIMNGVNTKYYANARKQSFKQTFYWASEDNKTIRELPAFTTAFLNREHLGGMIGKYTVLNETDKILMVLRPYQFYAAVEIVERVIHPPETDPNGYVWHTTGSGKTLTSFKAAQIITACRACTRWCSAWTARTWITKPSRCSTASAKAAWTAPTTPANWCSSSPTTPS